jgi:hypothetical protein
MAAPSSGNPHGWVYPPDTQSLAFNPNNAGIITDLSGATLNASTNLFVSPTVGQMNLTESGTYNVTVSNNYDLDLVMKAYDDIFDYTLSVADSIALLNCFTVGGTSNGLNVNMPSPFTKQTTNGATCTFDVSGVVNTLTSVLAAATDASASTVKQFLTANLNQFLNNISIKTMQSFSDSYLTLINTDLSAGISDGDVTLGIDVSSGVVVYDASGAVTSIGSACFGNTACESLINQVDLAHLLAYQNTTGNLNYLKTTALPALKGDQLVFVLQTDTPVVTMSYNKATSSAPSDPISLNAAWSTISASSSGTDFSYYCAFRLTLGGAGSSQAGAPTGAVPNAGTAFAVGTGALKASTW